MLRPAAGRPAPRRASAGLVARICATRTALPGQRDTRLGRLDNGDDGPTARLGLGRCDGVTARLRRRSLRRSDGVTRTARLRRCNSDGATRTVQQHDTERNLRNGEAALMQRRRDGETRMTRRHDDLTA